MGSCRTIRPESFTLIRTMTYAWGRWQSRYIHGLIQYNNILCSFWKPEHENSYGNWNSELTLKFCGSTMQPNLENFFCFIIYLFNIHIFHTHVSHFFRYMHKKGLSYILLNEQTFVSSNTLHGRDKAEASLEPPGIQSARLIKSTSLIQTRK